MRVLAKVRSRVACVMFLAALLAVPVKPDAFAAGTQPAKAKAEAKISKPEPQAAPAGAPAAAQGTHVGWLVLRGELHEGRPPLAIAGHSQRGSLKGVLDALRRIAEDNRYLGVVIHLDDPKLNLSQIAAIEARFKQIQAAGKPVIVFAETYSMLDYVLACSADEILLQRHGAVELQGIGVEEMYLSGLLEKIGAKADFVQIGQYKGAEEPLTRTGPSEAWNQNMDRLLDDLYSQVVERIMAGRKLTRAQVETLFRDSMLLDDPALLQRKVVDRIVDRDLVDTTSGKDVTDERFGIRYEWDEQLEADPATVRPENPLVLLQMLLQGNRQSIRRDSIAVVHCKGPIYSGDSAEGGAFSDETIGSRTIIETLRRLKDDTLVKGVVLHIDSPGGSAQASEVIWQAARDFIEKPPQKPLWINVGSMAASGGYYMACAGEQIYVAPSSIVGSIGVVGGKIALGGLYQTLGINVHRRVRGGLGDIFNSVEPFTPEQRQAITASMNTVYKQFLDRIRTGRGNRISDLDSVAQGRIFTGRQALKLGMVDKIGSLELTVTDLASSINLKPGQYDVVDFPEAPSLGEVIERMIGARSPAVPLASADQTMLQVVRSTLGERRWASARQIMAGLMQIRSEHVLTILPAAIIIDAAD